ncbi:UDP-GlcNAc:undecaprenyl-phosphate GlcNAc-1-phosphate transferase [Bacillus mesophilus]|uniref:Undecaprenyl/decaprenyl-phosphate alpha-N-acetylglucosaminyl 1-phosphate transferase n=1 Tax=Bacillus mesophilus TaxID=1808955 RepID=A0A6M0QB95_9BACI|nr:MraY family glycosyltransferase [Bacillus mesophilus]MBM7661619.1 UDP-GlcNAc:undecaprenyl-phosphate GlcNAc-1-phosphate transferase [Bacillus mesophilus]NEY72288.1 undecaprenyl/decaprenyl-phosphate alpha-N-acetylglucosaminyl 1-phosphate transferase [Bacillus mesophilus]
MNTHLWVGMLFSFITVILVTPLVIRLAFAIGATDRPNNRKVHQVVMPRIGGLAIFIGVLIGYIASGLYKENITAITVSSLLILLLGLYDDLYEVNAKVKLLVQLFAAVIVIISGLTIDFIQIPFLGKIQLGLFKYPITLLWIIGITNTINLIDGLDGLAVGISTIVIATIAILAALNGKYLILMLSLILLGSTLAFLFYNFYPAKIFMGDVGSLFLGYCISILSLLGLYKSVTLFSFAVPMIIMGVPVFDTFFAIFRRLKNRQPITVADKGHLHHRLLLLGLSHRATVLLLYLVSMIFSVTAYVFSSTVLWGTVLLCVVLFGIIVLIKGNTGSLAQNFFIIKRRLTGK